MVLCRSSFSYVLLDLRLIRVSVDRLRGYAIAPQELAEWSPSPIPYPARVTENRV
jgi:hypothetical protein